KNVLDGVTISPITGSIQVSNFTPNGEYLLEAWDPYQSDIKLQVLSSAPITADENGQIAISVADLGADIAVKIRPDGSQPTPSSTPSPTPSPSPSPTPTTPVEDASWPMAGANPERTSWTPEEVRGGVSPTWYRSFEAYIPPKVQIIAAYGTLYISTSEGLYALDAETGGVKWFYPTAFPLGHSPTIHNGVAYVGGFDHMIHAIDAYTGQGLWTFEAEKGFQTNPLVINGIVYAGNRDGYMYAIGANGTSRQGRLIWKYKTEGPILFSAAYSNGVIYFASNDSFAYALDSATGALIWKSDKLPGAGFHSWWPVVYQGVVIFSGSLNYRGTGPGPGTFPAIEVPEIFPNRFSDPRGTFVGPLGQEPGDWAQGTITIDTSQPMVTSNGSTLPITEYLESKPWRRSYFVLDASTGAEQTYDFDGDGKPSYAPILWLGDRNGNRYPPVVGGDGVLYQANVYLSDPWIPGGQISGWKFGTPYISRITSDWGAQDEPHAFSAGGNLIYWNLCCDREAGGIDITSPNGSYPAIDPDHETGYISYNLHNLIPGYDAMTYKDPDVDLYSSEGSVYGGRNGSYGWHGDVNPLIPYAGKLYTHRSNSIIAFEPGATDVTRLPIVEIAENVGPEPNTTSVDELRLQLEDEIQDILNAGHLLPGYAGSTFFDSPMECNGMLSEYWYSPSETLYTLLQSLPHLSVDLRSQTREYLQEEFTAYPPYEFEHIGWRDGTAREAFEIPPEVVADRANYPPMTQISNFVWKLNPFAFYSMWKYALEFGGARSLFDTAVSKNTLMDSLLSVPEDSLLLQLPFVHNAYIAGYYGYLELQSLAGYPESMDMRAQLDRLLVLRANTFTKDAPDSIFGPSHESYCRSINISRNFIFMVPELAEYLVDNALDKVEVAVREYIQLAPYWFVSKPEVAYGESVIQNLYDYLAIFQAKARILNEPYDVLVNYLDVPGVRTGDLFFIQNIVAALEMAPEEPIQTPTPSTTATPTPELTITPTATVPPLTGTPTIATVTTSTPTASITAAFTATPTASVTPSVSATPTPVSPTPTPTPAAGTPGTPAATESIPANTPTPTSQSSLPGDLNQDGSINILDLQLTINVFLGIENDPGITARADVNGDGIVNILDVQQLANLILSG
ncbi:MAG: PQQ-binding-like beta-propeller repeat protein, partial [Anaerolineales bacterium]|nr:PQQ-binding-like beta-propeller repeat protein [Anaerolineales bacterium]